MCIREHALNEVRLGGLIIILAAFLYLCRPLITLVASVIIKISSSWIFVRLDILTSLLI